MRHELGAPKLVESFCTSKECVLRQKCNKTPSKYFCRVQQRSFLINCLNITLSFSANLRKLSAAITFPETLSAAETESSAVLISLLVFLWAKNSQLRLIARETKSWLILMFVHVSRIFSKLIWSCAFTLLVLRSHFNFRLIAIFERLLFLFSYSLIGLCWYSWLCNLFAFYADSWSD